MDINDSIRNRCALAIEANCGVTRYEAVKINKAIVRLFHFVFSIVFELFSLLLVFFFQSHDV